MTTSEIEISKLLIIIANFWQILTLLLTGGPSAAGRGLCGR
jgi:hypothetical protein